MKIGDKCQIMDPEYGDTHIMTGVITEITPDRVMVEGLYNPKVFTDLTHPLGRLSCPKEHIRLV